MDRPEVDPIALLLFLVAAFGPDERQDKDKKLTISLDQNEREEILYDTERRNSLYQNTANPLFTSSTESLNLSEMVSRSVKPLSSLSSSSSSSSSSTQSKTQLSHLKNNQKLSFLTILKEAHSKTLVSYPRAVFLEAIGSKDSPPSIKRELSNNQKAEDEENSRFKYHQVNDNNSSLNQESCSRQQLISQQNQEHSLHLPQFQQHWNNMRYWLFVHGEGNVTYLLSYDALQQKWGNVALIEYPWMQDQMVDVDQLSMDLEEALQLVRSAGYLGTIQRMGLRKVLHPNVHEPVYSFSIPEDGLLVQVGVISKHVSVL